MTDNTDRELERLRATLQRVQALLPERAEDDAAASWLPPREVRAALDGPAPAGGPRQATPAAANTTRQATADTGRVQGRCPACGGHPDAQVGSACCGSLIGHYPGCRVNQAPAAGRPQDAAVDLRGGFWPSMTGGLCSVCHIAELRGGQADPDCKECRTVAAPAAVPLDPSCGLPGCLHRPFASREDRQRFLEVARGDQRLRRQPPDLAKTAEAIEAWCHDRQHKLATACSVGECTCAALAQFFRDQVAR